MGTDFDRLV